MLIRSDFLFTAQNQILENAAIESANDKIIAVGSSVEILKGRKPDYDFGNGLILPGLVNAHTHLDLSRFLNKIPSKLKFTEWLKQFIKIRPEIGYLTQKEYSQKIDEQIEYGITTIADINQSGEFINNTQARLILFLELLGFTPQMVSQKKEWFKENLQIKKSGITYGVSPHAPYSTTSELFDLAAQSGMMQMIHYKESNPEPNFSIKFMPLPPNHYQEPPIERT
jgi:cytosine/adenosine deaminase-related metal-dependent hydrolase